MAANPDVADELQAIYSYMRNFWEHIIAHYMYAFGMYTATITITWRYSLLTLIIT